MATDRESQFLSQETSVPLYPVPSKETTAVSFDSNPGDEFSFRSTSPDSSEDYSGSIDNTITNTESNNPYLSNIFNRKRFEWLLEVDDTGDDDDMNKPLL